VNDAILDARKRAAVEWFESLQGRIIAAFEALERRDDFVLAEPGAAAGAFVRTPW
jgi:coproporphyrinogen III oxidase